MVDAFDGKFGGNFASISGGKRKRGNGHKASCGCPICNNMRKKGKKGGVLLVGGSENEVEGGLVGVPSGDQSSNSSGVPPEEGQTKQEGGRRRRSRSRSRSKSRRRSAKGGKKKRKSKKRR